MDHKSKNSHHGHTTIVQLDGTFGELGLLIEFVPSKVNVPITEITNKLISSSWNILHDAGLQETNEEEDLGESILGNGIGPINSRPSIAERAELMSGVVDGAREVDAGAGDNVAQEGEHGHAAVLDLDVAKAVESSLVGIVKQTKWVEEAKGGLGSKLGLEGAHGRGDGLNLFHGSSLHRRLLDGGSLRLGGDFGGGRLLGSLQGSEGLASGGSGGRKGSGRGDGGGEDCNLINIK